MAPKIGVTSGSVSDTVPFTFGEQFFLTITPKLEKRRQSRGALVAQPQCAPPELSTARTSKVVLENARGAIESEALAKFDNGNQERRLGKRFSDFTKGLQFLRGRLYAAHAIVFFPDRRGGAVDGGAKGLLNVGADIAAFQRSTIQVWLLVCLGLRVLQLLRPVIVLGFRGFVGGCGGYTLWFHVR